MIISHDTILCTDFISNLHRGLLSFLVDLHSDILTVASKATILDRVPEVSKRL